ncbi:hypothetical protein CK203_039357 [Vitis vinifera]|uniref:Uncharacterized protein n=1 Tax=Vitis vinifera TaxID=29760 RepID=A0A438HGK3_VITVI|nr:hypothetical protein CK203_039357 [Vitis vinifera]
MFGRCVVQLLLDPPLQNVITRGVASSSAVGKDKERVSDQEKEILFIYTIKMSGKEISSLSTHIPSIQLVTGLPNSTKGATKRHIVVSGPWVSSYEHPILGFEPHCSLGILGKRRRNWLVDWVEKTSFDRLNKLFVISTSERNHETLLTYQNLQAMTSVTNWNSIRSPLVGDIPNRELRLVVLYIILELEEEEEEEEEAQMAPNLRVGFKERHCKRLSEALPTTPPPAKKTRLEELIASPSVEDIFPMEDGTPTTTPNGDANEKDFPVYPSIWEEITALLKMLTDDTRLAGMVCPSYGTPESVLIRCRSSMLFQGVAAIHNLMRQRSSLLKWLEVVKTMRTFLTQWIDNDEELRAQLVRVENELVVARKATADGEKLLKESEEEMQATKVEAHRMGEEKEAVEAICKDVEQEKDQLKKELEEL